MKGEEGMGKALNSADVANAFALCAGVYLWMRRKAPWGGRIERELRTIIDEEEITLVCWMLVDTE